VPAGDLNFVGATNIIPSGSGTTAQATQGATTVSVPNNYAATFAFDPLLTGSWTLTATDVAGPVSVTANAIPNPELIPFVTNLQITGPLLTPHISWTLPDLTGLGVTRLSFRVRDLNRFSIDSVTEQIFQSAFLVPTTTSFDIPNNVLALGGRYSFDILLDNVVTPPSGPAFLQNRSETFTGVYSTPEPATLFVLVLGVAGLAALGRERSRRVSRSGLRALRGPAQG
jgi:hypothetical protein